MGDEEYNKAWKILPTGRTYEVNLKIDVGGNIIEVKHIFMPICDVQGNLLNVILLAIHDQQEELRLNIEEIRSQDEELRQNLEEMRATQDDMRRHEIELEKVLEQSQKSEKMFEEKTHWYEFMLDALPEPVSVTDMNKNITFLNRAGLDILQKTREEVMGKFCGDVWGVDICKDERCGVEFLKCGKGKSVFVVGDQTFTTSASFIRNIQGAKVGHIEVVENITKAVNDEKALRLNLEESKMQIQKLDLVLEVSKIALWENKIIGGDPANPDNPWTWSDDLRRMLGFTDQTDFPNIGDALWGRIHKDDVDMVNDAYEKHISDRTGKTPYDVEYRISKKNGTYITVHESAATLREKDGTPLFVLGTWREV
jgi:PAS domain-containing protein